MADLRSQLVDCFVLVFPGLKSQEASSASMGSLASWDSLAGITLLAVVEEEFRVSIPPDELAQLSSFELILDYLRRSQSESRA
jgi:acyl carrier protein